MAQQGSLAQASLEVALERGPSRGCGWEASVPPHADRSPGPLGVLRSWWRAFPSARGLRETAGQKLVS